MAKVIIINNTRAVEKRIIKEAGKRGSIKIGLAGAGFLTVAFVVFFSAFYLFQVNDLAMKGYEIKEVETKIANLKKDNDKMQIREMELRSMYSVEKVAPEFNLVSPVNVSYLELNDLVALK
ncbi:MAG: hypothetical protein WAV31_01600 [Candidatus Moraniibacteriota bacterium]